MGSVLGFVEGQQRRIDEKKRLNEEAARAEEERQRIQAEKTREFVKRHWKVLLAAFVAFMLILVIGALSGTDDEVVSTETTTKPSSSPQPAAQVATESAAQVATESADQGAAAANLAAQKLESKFPIEKAKRAAVVALTNATAADVFKSDGNSYDVSKFHSYADTSRNADDYFWDVRAWGTWSAKDERTWHVESLLLKHRLGQEIDVALDVRLEGTSYLVSNVKGTRGKPGYMEELYVEDGPFWSVPAKLVKDNRKQSSVDALDHSSDLDKFAARTAFEGFGKSEYPYGFKCAWSLGLINEEQRSDGSWFFKVDAKITNQYGTARSAVAEGVVSGTTASPTVRDFYAD
ncbi:MAG: hypothetical protein Q8S43_04735 [Actinomycetota bacterium]|nr:hypothetical protein [Actinomycetota bacterium]MDP3630244.1 hypothetical protein [Actinomycetota bacterium]